MDAARVLFGGRNAFGVYAFGIGPRIRKGHPSKSRALNVYVERKLASPKAPVPELVVRIGKSAWRLVPNVIATGKRPQAAAGANTPYTGLHAGAVVSVGGATPGRGALGCILGSDGTPTHALTAGHLFPVGALGTLVSAAAAPGAQVRKVGKLVANFLDGSDVDAAVIELTPAGVAMVNDAGPPLSDYVPERSAWGKLARAFLATTNDFSREVATGEGPLDALFSAPTRGTFWVRGAIATDGEMTLPGDSGTVLCTGASNEFALGLCSGALGAHSVFQPIERALGLAQQHVAPDLTII